MYAEQSVIYQAFFRTREDGVFIGGIAHDTTHVDQMPIQELRNGCSMRQARQQLREAVTLWALDNNLAKLPEPLPFIEDKDRPVGVAAMIPLKVPFTPTKAYLR